VPNLTIGIMEAAWRVKPNFIVLTPELQEAQERLACETSEPGC
jgi:hypothetical protein